MLAGWVGRYVYVWLSAAADGTAGTTGGTGASGGTFVAYHLKSVAKNKKETKNKDWHTCACYAASEEIKNKRIKCTKERHTRNRRKGKGQPGIYKHSHSRREKVINSGIS